MPQPDYMIDCQFCGSQAWAIKRHTDENVTVECLRCPDGLQSFDLSGVTSGTECPQCGRTTWSVTEKREDHLIVACDGCATLSEAWFQEP